MFSLVAFMLSKRFPFFFIENMSVLDSLLDKSRWQEFLEHKISKSHLTKTEEQNLIDFVNNERYLTVAKGIADGTYAFSFPTKSLVNKSGSTKKRVVYTFDDTESMILKFIVFNMSKYDHIFSSNCYSFRKNSTVRKAFYSIIDNADIGSMFAYKLDISNYFNSIAVSQLLPMLHSIFADDERLYQFFYNILTTNKAVFDGEIIEEPRGVMAGTPMSTFFANVYLMDMDKYFLENGVVYARYSDDIIIFDKNIDSLKKNIEYIHTIISHKNLDINAEKEQLFAPHEAWNFLGFEYSDGTIDLSMVTLKKIKDKIRRKSRSIYRWRLKNEKSTEEAIKVMLRVFNNKFYREDHQKDLTWSKWFFPVITTHTRLNIIDNYLVQYLRYLENGRFTKKNYNISYNYLKSLGFKSLVNEYHKSKK